MEILGKDSVLIEVNVEFNFKCINLKGEAGFETQLSTMPILMNSVTLIIILYGILQYLRFSKWGVTFL